jgi:hypothetical protein
MPPYGEIRGNRRALPATARQRALRPEPTGTTFEEGGWELNGLAGESGASDAKRVLAGPGRIGHGGGERGSAGGTVGP